MERGKDPLGRRKVHHQNVMGLALMYYISIFPLEVDSKHLYAVSCKLDHLTNWERIHRRS